MIKNFQNRNFPEKLSRSYVRRKTGFGKKVPEKAVKILNYNKEKIFLNGLLDILSMSYEDFGWNLTLISPMTTKKFNHKLMNFLPPRLEGHKAIRVFFIMRQPLPILSGCILTFYFSLLTNFTTKTQRALSHTFDFFTTNTSRFDRENTTYHPSSNQYSNFSSRISFS